MRKELVLLTIPILIAGLLLLMGNSVNDVIDSTKPQGNIYICIEKFSGKECHWIQNTVTNIAKNQTRDIRMGNIGCSNATGSTNGGSINCTWGSLMLSTDIGPVNATTNTCPSVYDSNGLSPANGTIAVVDSTIGNYSVNVKWTAIGTTSAIYKLCISNHTATTSPLMASGFINNTVSGYILDKDENITGYYYIAET